MITVDAQRQRPTQRRRHLALTGVVGVAALLALVAGCGSGAAKHQALPDTRMVTLDGDEPVTFASFHGKPLVVNLWASWCTPCRAEMPALERVHQALGDDVTIIGLTDDANQGDASAAAATAGVTYPLLVDTEGRFQSQLGITGLPATVFVDADGTVVSTHLGAYDESGLREEIRSLYGTS